MKNGKTKIINTRYNEFYYDIRINRILLEELIVKIIKITLAIISVLAVFAIIGLSPALVFGELTTPSIIIYIISWLWFGMVALIGHRTNK